MSSATEISTPASSSVSSGAPPFRHMRPTSPPPIFPWPDLQQSEINGRGSYEYRTEPVFSTASMGGLVASPQDQTANESTTWTYGNPDGSGLPSSSLLWDNLPFRLAPNPGAPSQIHTDYTQQPFSTLQGVSSQKHGWRDSVMTRSLDGMRPTSHPQFSPTYALDAASSSGPSLYRTTLDQQISIPSAMEPSYQDSDDAITIDSNGTDDESAQGEPPYATLIYRALMEAPEHRLVLRDIYAWISDNTDKAKDPAFKGWQNSVRHNLSMNGAFRKVDHIDPVNKHKKGYIWVLDPFAVGRGIESTTRYRQKTVGRRPYHSDLTDPKRQKSGRKGGRAARQSASLRRSAKLEYHRPTYPHLAESDYSSSPSTIVDSPPSPSMSRYDMGGLPYYVNTPPPHSPVPGHPFYDIEATNAGTDLALDQTYLKDSPASSGTLVDDNLEDDQAPCGFQAYA